MLASVHGLHVAYTNLTIGTDPKCPKNSSLGATDMALVESTQQQWLVLIL